MYKLTDIVPPPKLCESLPEGKFMDSALVWHEESTPVGYMRELINRNEVALDEYEEMLPAPTAEEIARVIYEEFHLFTQLHYNGGVWIARCFTPIEYSSHSKRNGAEAMLKLWTYCNKHVKKAEK